MKTLSKVLYLLAMLAIAGAVIYTGYHTKVIPGLWRRVVCRGSNHGGNSMGGVAGKGEA